MPQIAAAAATATAANGPAALEDEEQDMKGNDDQRPDGLLYIQCLYQFDSLVSEAKMSFGESACSIHSVSEGLEVRFGVTAL